MDRLPIEIIYKIFGYLNLDHLLHMRLQSKLFNELVRLMTIRELTFCESRLIFPIESDQMDIELTMERMFVLKGNWFYTSNRSFNFHNPVALSRLHLLSKSIINLKAIRHLRIRNDPIYPDPPFKLPTDHLNKLGQLQHLDLDLTCMQPNNEQRHLLNHLPNLVELQVHSARAYREINLVVRGSPKLRGLVLFGRIGFCQVQPASSVTHLRALIYHESMSQFENLRYLECESLLPDNLLTTFSRLEELRVNHSNDLSEFLRQRDELGRMQLKIYQYSVELTTGDQLAADVLLHKVRSCSYLKYYVGNMWSSGYSYKEIAPHTLEQFYLTHYSRLANNLDEANTLNFGFLISTFRSIIPFGLYAKFSNVKSLQVGRLGKDELPVKFREHSLIQLIDGCLNLCALTLYVPFELSQQFYDQLPVISSLFVLILRQKRDSRLNFAFLNRLGQLRCFETSHEVDPDELALDSLRYLGYFKFTSNSQSFEIKRAKETAPFRMFRGGRKIFEAARFSELIGWFTTNRSPAALLGTL